MVTPKQLENDIKNLNYEQINKIINKSTNEVDIYFWLTIRDRVLQLSLKQVIKQKNLLDKLGPYWKNREWLKMTCIS